MFIDPADGDEEIKQKVDLCKEYKEARGWENEVG